MRLWQFCIGFLWSAVTLSALPESREQPFVSARAERSVVEFGSSVVVNCSTTCPHPTAGDLQTSLEKEVVGNGSTWRAFQILNISCWDPAPSCFFECPDVGDMKPQRVNLTVYRLPKRVMLDPVPVIEVGENYTLTCRVPSVAPIRNLSVIFRQGGRKLHTETFEQHSAREANDVVVNHTVTARHAVYGENISCQAVLDLWPRGPTSGRTSFSQMLNIMDYTGIIVATASAATLAVLLVVIGIYASCPKKQ